MADVDVRDGQVVIRMSNRGTATLQLVVYAQHTLDDTVQRLDLHAGGTATSHVPVEPVTGAYDVWIHGRNGFLRHATGDLASSRADVEAALELEGDGGNPGLRLRIRNRGSDTQTVHMTGLRNVARAIVLAAHEQDELHFDGLASTLDGTTC